MLKTTVLKNRTRGAALAEYGILVGLIAVAASSSVSILGGKVRGTFDTAQAALNSNIEKGGSTVSVDTTHGSATIIPTAHPSEPTLFGYEGGTSATQYGTLISTAGNISGLDLFRFDSNASSVAFIPTTDTRALLVGKALSCQDGTVLNFDDADLIYYFGPNNNTQYRWDGVASPAFVDGEKFTCGIADM